MTTFDDEMKSRTEEYHDPEEGPKSSGYISDTNPPAQVESKLEKNLDGNISTKSSVR
jgi:hypothetical protein